MDEIGTSSDMESIIATLNSGVNLVLQFMALMLRIYISVQYLKRLWKIELFKRAVVLSNKKGVGTIEYVYDFTKGEKK